MVVYNKLIPFKGFLAMNLFGIIFVRSEYRNINSYSFDRMLSHEAIHSEQMKDFTPKFLPLWMRLALGGIVFYITYLLEWLYRLLFHTKTAYRGISYEREAFAHENEEGYLKERRRFAQWI